MSILSESLASYLQNIYEPTKGKVISIEFDYVNSYTYVPNVPSLDINPTIYTSTSTSPDLFLKDKSTALIKLNYENSIYNEKDIFLNPNNPQTEYFQYLIMFSDSSGATRWSLLQSLLVIFFYPIATIRNTPILFKVEDDGCYAPG